MECKHLKFSYTARCMEDDNLLILWLGDKIAQSLVMKLITTFSY